ncbi:MAG: hypothetical protein WB663_13660, partial [Beijerinckiaceae bacterium]
SGLFERIDERTVPAAQIFRPILDDIYDLSASAPTPVDVAHRRRLAPECVFRRLRTGIPIEAGQWFERLRTAVR